MNNGLVVENLVLKRGGITVCKDISLTAPEGEITVVIGANGAGKTTLLDGIAGMLPASSGRVSLDSQRIEKLPLYRRAKRGLSYVEQGRAVFGALTVIQNLAVVDPSLKARDAAVELFPRLADKLDTRASLLSGGEQQMLLIARAIAMRPRILMVDELSLGLAPKVVQSLMETLSSLAQQGLGILLVEQFAEMALRIGTTAHIVERGRIVTSAPCAELLRDRSVIESTYLSGSAHGSAPGRTDTNPPGPDPKES